MRYPGEVGSSTLKSSVHSAVQFAMKPSCQTAFKLPNRSQHTFKNRVPSVCNSEKKCIVKTSKEVPRGC